MSKQKWHTIPKELILKEFHVTEEQGLRNDAIHKLMEKYGRNQLEQKQSMSPISLFLDQFKDFMVLVLLVATLISGLLGEYTDAITIIAIVIMNAVLGFVQEFRAEKSLQALKEMAAPHARVIRSGKVTSIPAVEVVPGDLVLLESGDRVPADIRLIKTYALYIEESALTGESVPVNKQEDVIPYEDIPLGDQKNMAFMGTLVTRGTGVGVVVETGMNTEMGKIADLIQSTEEVETPLQRRLEQLGKILIIISLILTALVVVTGIWHGHNAYAMFLAGVSLAVAAIPEGLPAIVTVALALGVQRMIKRKAIVRKLPSVETLGCATVICSDKTGTLTQNKMTVTDLWIDGEEIKVTGTGYVPSGEFFLRSNKVNPERNVPLKQLLEISVLCNNAQLVEDHGKKGFFKRSKGDWDIQGDPTEGALVVLAAKANIHKKELEQLWVRKKEFPFDSSRKMMSVIVEKKDQRFVVVKGAPDVLLDRCSSIILNGHVMSLTPIIKNQVKLAIEKMASRALRNLGFAYKELTKGEVIVSEEDAEKNLTFVGIAGMIDPPREEVKKAIQTCKNAGIKTVMITGDHQTTAEAIAKTLNILPPHGLTVNGQDLYNMSNTEFMEKVDDIYVYARVSPEHKLRIVKALQAKGHVVAMTGDGVNDAPAIKAADIGISMGITGTDVSKEASSLVLSDDNFATIVAAIEEGRGIYDNIRKFIRYLLASNVGEILTMFFAMLMGLPLPLVPIQILWVNLVTDGLPAMALGVDPAEEDIMNRPPRDSKENVFARGLGWKIISRGFLIGLVTLGVFWLTWQTEPENLIKAQTMAFSTLVMAQLIHVFDCRSDKSVFHRNLFENKYLVFAALSSLLLLLGVIYIEPLQPIFRTVSLTLSDWVLITIAGAIPTVGFGLANLIYHPKFLMKKVSN
ncbi:calcium-translocating P-type ATPase, SERCA-type [Tepidibacillus fermentans]|uniref:P-type Ca(2+) transporter n=1 Tax=Tepidibacillus fermentans TaxID=1281767 RepID=A0A4R3KLB1_9BACI|nr:calcium-translocating P-type ATPase, SERCA-type [Tepidibacillus fermentans]TCS84370.1 Ca2+-transporting ATPase [Tepidibacillus fermentans]